jgi:LemA protein
MDIQIRRILTRLYPSRSGNGRHREDAPRRRFLGRFVDRRLKRVGTRFKRMGRKRLVVGAVVVVVVLNAWAVAYYYNNFMQLQSNIAGARSQVIVQLQRRKDVVAELNAVVLAYAKHEKEIFEHAVNTRKEIMRPGATVSSEDAPPVGPRLPFPVATLDASLSKVLAVAEGFPGLRLSENYQRLMDALVQVETNLAEQRMLLNSRCNAMETELYLFPGVVYNWALRFKVPTYYIPDEDVHAPISLEPTPQLSGKAQRAEPHGDGRHE